MRTLTDAELHTLNDHAVLIDEATLSIMTIVYECSGLGRASLHDLITQELAVLVARVTEAERCQA